MIGVTLKICCKCHQDLPPDRFGKNRSTPDGLHPTCKECRRPEALASHFRRTQSVKKYQKRKHVVDRTRGAMHEVQPFLYAIHETARIAPRKVLNAYGWREQDLHPYDLGDLESEVYLKLLTLFRLKRYRDNFIYRKRPGHYTAWMYTVGLNVCKSFITSKVLRFRRVDELDALVMTDREPSYIPDFDGVSLREQLKAQITIRHGADAWAEVWEWANSSQKQVPPRVAELLREVVEA